MKKITFTLTIIITSLILNAQTYFSSPNQMNVTTGYAGKGVNADINADGYVDLLITTGYANKIMWYKNNTDGTFDEFIIDTIDNPISITGGDFDDDGYTDVIAISQDYSYVAWYRNTDGLGTFSGGQIFNTNITNPRKVLFIDINGDNKKDIVISSSTDSKVVWYENLGLGNYGPEQIIANKNYSDYTIGDIDGDGDNDIVGVNNSEVSWVENINGTGTFNTPTIISTNINFENNVFLADIDGDSDIDILTASYNTDDILWYENTDGAGTFGPKKTISHLADGVYGIYAADLDNDGDIDVLSASSNDSIVAWYENLGSGVFDTLQQNILSDIYHSPRCVLAADVDNDGDNDVFSIAYWHRDVVWYENITLDIINNPNDASECITNDSYFTIKGNDYDSIQWQVNTGSGFVDIVNNSTYSGANSDTLFIYDIDASMDGYIYRCKLINLIIGELISDNATLYVPADNIAPTVICMANQVRPADSSHTYTVIGNEFDLFSLSDNCNIQSVVNNYNNDYTLANATFPEGTTTVTWMATDYSGNTSTCSFDITIDIFTKINKISLNNLMVTPNPAYNNLQITTNNKQLGKNIEVLDITGKIINCHFERSEESISIDVSNLQNGIYFIKIDNVVTKFIKE